jgi:hypothetical protein
LIKPRTTCWNVQRLKLENRRCAIASNAGANTAALPGYPTKMVLAPRLAEPINGEQYEHTIRRVIDLRTPLTPRLRRIAAFRPS